MGFDKHFNQDHCYFEEAEHVGMNVEIMDDNCPVTPITPEKSIVSYSEEAIISNGIVVKGYFDDDDNSVKKVMSHLVYPHYCLKHEGMFLHEDEKLVKPGDKFASHEEFINYLNDNAKRWHFYYKCSDSHKPSAGYESYTYNCVYLKDKDKYKKRGLRKRSNGLKTDCPCKIKLRQLGNEQELTVVYVCNHHDHDLSDEEFHKLQHGRRLPPYVREEIMDFLALRFDVRKIKAYVERETGFSMTRAFFYTLEKNMKRKYMKRYLTEKRLHELWEKINSVQVDDENNDDDDYMHQVQKCTKIEADTSNSSRISRTGLESAKRRSKTIDGNIVSKRCKQEDDPQIKLGDGRQIKLEDGPQILSNELIESVEQLQESIKCETVKNPWIPDQCVPVLPNRTSDEPIHIEIKENPEMSSTQNESGNVSYTIHYYDHNSEAEIQEIINKALSEVINDGTNNTQTNDGNYITYETVVTDGNEFLLQNDGEGIENEPNTNGNDISAANVTEVNEDQSNVDFSIENEHENTIENSMEFGTESEEGMVEEYLEETDDVNNGNDVGVQTSTDQKSLVPVFDVYMKDGNVTGFVVNNNAMHGLKDTGIDKEVQTIENEKNNGHTQQPEPTNDDLCDTEIIYEKTGENLDTYTKHEYVHKNNIDKYMMQRHFPKYIKILAKQTNADAVRMISNVYRERGMFKMTTTQRGREGNTRIWYISEAPRFRRRVPSGNMDHVEEIMILKDKIRALQKQNSDLAKRNKYLEDVALKLLNG